MVERFWSMQPNGTVVAVVNVGGAFFARPGKRDVIVTKARF